MIEVMQFFGVVCGTIAMLFGVFCAIVMTYYLSHQWDRVCPQCKYRADTQDFKLVKDGQPVDA